MTYEMISGSQAAAIAVQRVGVDLVAAYPITPQTAIVETLADFNARGELGGEFVSVESEYSALACCNGASAAGARVFTATASHGLAYMHEMIHWCSGARLPIVMVNVNRAIGAPWCLDPDQGDSLSQRDTGWLQIYCANAQEVFDTVLQAFPLAEELLLPCMVVFDGFYISHTYEVVDLAEKSLVQSLIGPPNFAAQIVPGHPANLHGLSTGETVHRLVKNRYDAMLRAPEVFAGINKQFKKVFGRSYKEVEENIPTGAKKAFMAVGALAETVQWFLPDLKDTGLIKLRMFRPFPADQLCAIVEKYQLEEIIVLDRNYSLGSGGIFAQELAQALYRLPTKPVIRDLVLTGGIDLTGEMLLRMIDAERADNNFPYLKVWGDDLK
jgi:2-oxoisovalerate ferredoxin oxidoreductase alpha subunit